MATNDNANKAQPRWRSLLRLPNRRSTANTLMLSFIIMTSIGGFIISPAVGFLIAGATCGLFGFLLGLE